MFENILPFLLTFADFAQVLNRCQAEITRLTKFSNILRANFFADKLLLLEFSKLKHLMTSQKAGLNTVQTHFGKIAFK